jgi:hypothetical protein
VRVPIDGVQLLGVLQRCVVVSLVMFLVAEQW